MSEACVICGFAAGNIPRWVIYETNSVICFLPLKLNAYGHMVIAPKNHLQTCMTFLKIYYKNSPENGGASRGHYKKVLDATG